jgi:hypothetical protein
VWFNLFLENENVFCFMNERRKTKNRLIALGEGSVWDRDQTDHRRQGALHQREMGRILVASLALTPLFKLLLLLLLLLLPMSAICLHLSTFIAVKKK